MITATELNDAIQWLRSGEDCGLDYLETKRLLTACKEYAMLLTDASVVEFNVPSVEVGLIAGLRLASLLLGKEIQFQSYEQTQLGC